MTKNIFTTIILGTCLFQCNSTFSMDGSEYYKNYHIKNRVVSGDIEALRQSLEKSPFNVNSNFSERPMVLPLGVEDYDVSYSMCKTPLTCACGSKGLDASKRLQMVKCLVEEYHADINQADASGRSPLICAARSGSLEVCRYLIEKGADTRFTEGSGVRDMGAPRKTASDYAREHRHYELRFFLESPEVKFAWVGRPGTTMAEILSLLRTVRLGSRLAKLIRRKAFGEPTTTGPNCKKTVEQQKTVE